jgi:transglutaminase-like putative cysteine protease
VEQAHSAERGVIVLMKKTGMVCCWMLFFLFQATAPAFASAPALDVSNVNQGIIQVKVVNPNSKKMKILIEKGSVRYSYTLQAKSVESFPLQIGNGAYSISILENVTGDQYRILSQQSVTLSVNNENVIYLNSIQLIDWDTTMQAIAKTKELTAGKATDREKFDVIYAYMVSNFAYDFDKLQALTSDYLPVIDRVYNAKKGICYDYAAVFGAMLRSANIPSKLIMGYCDYVTQYHAWNEVLLGGQWVVVDTTTDAAYVRAGQTINAFKEPAKYRGVKQY